MRKQQRGFSLIELIIVMVIISIIAVVIGNILFNSFRTFRVSQDVTDTDWQGLLAIESIANDVHDIRSANDISTINAASFTFVEVGGTSVTYQLSGNNLQRSGTTLASNISALAFAYLDNNGATTTTPSEVRYVRITVTASQNNLVQTFTTLAGTRGMP